MANINKISMNIHKGKYDFSILDTNYLEYDALTYECFRFSSPRQSIVCVDRSCTLLEAAHQRVTEKKNKNNSNRALFDKSSSMVTSV